MSFRIFVLLFVSLAFLAPCYGQRANNDTMRTVSKQFASRRQRCLSQPIAICNLQSVSGTKVTGSVKFTPVFSFIKRRFRCSVRIQAFVSNLSPGKHGFHIHTFGDTRSTDGKSTGGHFSNPRGKERKHGFSYTPRRHWGDLDNLVANSKGIANYDRKDTMIRTRGIVGRGMTIHIGEDKGPDFPPTGDAGSRVAICVIGYANLDIED